MTFTYHYSKPASQKAGIPQLSLHFSKACHIVDKLIISVPTLSHNQKRQPRLVIKGKAKQIIIENKIAYIQ